jgi:hypothetical protein
MRASAGLGHTGRPAALWAPRWVVTRRCRRHVENPRLARTNFGAAAPVEQHASLGPFRGLVLHLLVIARGGRRILRRPQLQRRTEECLGHRLPGFVETGIGARPNRHIHPAPGTHGPGVAEDVAVTATLAAEHGADSTHAAHGHAHAGKGRDVDPGLRRRASGFLRERRCRKVEKQRTGRCGHDDRYVRQWLHGLSPSMRRE